MAKRALKITGFTRFFLVMLFVVPLAYIVASYYNGQDGIQNIKNFLGIGQPKEVLNNEPPATLDTRTVNQSPAAKALEDENKKLKQDLEYKTRRVEELTQENDALKRKLESLEKTLQESQKQTK